MPYKDPIKRKEKEREYYSKNKEKIKKKQREIDLKRHKEVREWFSEFKSTLKCLNCPEYDPVCLDFHHRDPDKKEKSVASAIQSRWSKDRIMKEVDKCDVLCSNCHRKLHAKMLKDKSPTDYNTIL